VDFEYSGFVYGGRGFCRTHIHTSLAHTRTEQGVYFVYRGRVFCIWRAWILYLCQKRPTKETYICQKRPIKDIYQYIYQYMDVPKRVCILNIAVLYMEGVDIVAHTCTPHSHAHVLRRACIVYMESVYFVYGRTEEGVDFVYGRFVYGGRDSCGTHMHNSHTHTRCEEGVNCIHMHCILNCIHREL